MSYCLTRETDDGVVSAITGNGAICTTVGPSGYHTRDAAGTSGLTQRFTWAGRRLRGPRHPLVDFGSVSGRLYLDGADCDALDFHQEIDWKGGAVLSRIDHGAVREETRSFVALQDNVFIAETSLTNTGDQDLDVSWIVMYTFGDLTTSPADVQSPSRIVLQFQAEDHLGELGFGHAVLEGTGGTMQRVDSDEVSAETRSRLAPGEGVRIRSWVRFSDRRTYHFPLSVEGIDGVVARHERGWAEFWARSDVRTNDPVVDAFRLSALYTLRCQATAWSVPPTLSETYWGGGAFHDELYPFLGLLSSGYADLAARMPYFRLTTLPKAVERACSQGALYPWSSTEDGEERDPNGLWLTERFHLGQFAMCVWTLWLYERDPVQLEDLYPVLREIARYYERHMLERDEAGRLRTRECVDFDESVGPVHNGPFTISAAIASLECAAKAAGVLARDRERAVAWTGLAAELRANLPGGEDRFEIPDGKPLHYSILGPTFPFGIDTRSERAVRSAAHVTQTCRSTRGWRPGLSPAYDGSNWMWVAGHIAVVHAVQRNAEAAWEAICMGPASAGPLLSPNEHVDKDGVVRVPWFTTGVGGWIHALNALFVQVDDEGAVLLPAVPRSLSDVEFRGLRASCGVAVSGTITGGRLVALTARSPRDLRWTFRVPSSVASSVSFAGMPLPGPEGDVSVSVALTGGADVSLLA